MADYPKTIKICFTRGGRGTIPGGCILRQLSDNEDDYVAHHFSREAGSTKPTSFFWGTYGSRPFTEAAYNAKVRRIAQEVINRSDVEEKGL